MSEQIRIRASITIKADVICNDLENMLRELHFKAEKIGYVSDFTFDSETVSKQEEEA